MVSSIKKQNNIGPAYEFLSYNKKGFRGQQATLLKLEIRYWSVHSSSFRGKYILLSVNVLNVVNFF